MKSVGSAGAYTFRKRQTATANTTGKFALEGLSADQTYGIGSSGHANETQEKDFVIIQQTVCRPKSSGPVLQQLSR